MLIEQQIQQAQRDGEMDMEMPNMGGMEMPDVPNMPSGGGQMPQMGGGGGHSDRVHPALRKYNTVYHIEGDDADEE